VKQYVRYVCSDSAYTVDNCSSSPNNASVFPENPTPTWTPDNNNGNGNGTVKYVELDACEEAAGVEMYVDDTKGEGKDKHDADAIRLITKTNICTTLKICENSA
jgi:hypothetical protein